MCNVCTGMTSYYQPLPHDNFVIGFLIVLIFFSLKKMLILCNYITKVIYRKMSKD